MLIKLHCPNKKCNKIQKESSFTIAGNNKFIKLECGHTVVEPYIAPKEMKVISFDQKELYPFQYEGVKAAEKNNLRFLFADEMGLGKTPQVLGTLLRNPEAFPILYLVKSGLRKQWQREIIRWLGKEYGITQIVYNPKTKIIPGMNGYIVSLDLMRNLNLEKLYTETKFKTIVIDECQLIKNSDSQRTQTIQKLASGKIYVERKFNPNIDQRIKMKIIAEDLMKWNGIWGRFKLNFEDIGKGILGQCECKAEMKNEGTITGIISFNPEHVMHENEDEVVETILHEIAHAITPGAGHSKIWVETSLAIGGDGKAKAWCKGTIEPQKLIEKPLNILAASGTPIKNRALEFFPILNMLDPRLFPYKSDFESNWCGSNGGLRPFMVQSFIETTKHLMIRRERKEVMPDLPLINRMFFHTELEEKTERMYEEQMKGFMKAHDEMEEEGGWGNNAMRTNVLAYIARMRHICGIAMIDPCIEWIDEFFEETKDRKICVFVHHNAVALGVINKLKEKYGDGMVISSDMSVDVRDRQKQRFIEDPSIKWGVLSTLSSGEGLDGLQKVCSDMILLERQWNPANEEQVEGRFSRIGSAFNQVNATYFLATGTIVEWLSDLVEKKRKIVKQTMTGEELTWTEESLMRELVEMVARKGGKKWSLT